MHSLILLAQFISFRLYTICSCLNRYTSHFFFQLWHQCHYYHFRFKFIIQITEKVFRNSIHFRIQHTASIRFVALLNFLTSIQINTIPPPALYSHISLAWWWMTEIYFDGICIHTYTTRDGRERNALYLWPEWLMYCHRYAS